MGNYWLVSEHRVVFIAAYLDSKQHKSGKEHCEFWAPSSGQFDDMLIRCFPNRGFRATQSQQQSLRWMFNTAATGAYDAPSRRTRKQGVPDLSVNDSYKGYASSL